VLQAVDGRHDYHEIADAVSTAAGRSIDADGVRTLVADRLRPLGVVRLADGSEPELRKANPLLALRMRYVVTDPTKTQRLTAPFAPLFTPVIVVAVVAAFVWICQWLLFSHGLAFATHQAFARPGLLLAVFLVTLLSAGWHEFGHAAAARYGGATPGAMGAGIYLAWPAFYTDVTDAYRLGRLGRLRTDLGGLYFNAVLSVLTFGVWWLTKWDALLLVIATQLLQMIRQLPPLLRFDGYHVLADTVGVPDLFHHIRPTLRGLWPGNWGHDSALKPWARAVVTLWVLVVVPLMALTILITVLTLPRIVATAGAGMRVQAAAMGHAFGRIDVLSGLAKLLALIAIALPVAGITYMLWRTVRRVSTRTWQATENRPVRRSLAMLVAAALVAALAFAWWPRGNYRQIQPYERGTITDAMPASWTGLREGQQLSRTVAVPAGVQLPSAAHPALALVLLPRSGSGPTWVFPFNKPAPPGPGDNQSLAVNTKNGSSVYDVAFALVWTDQNTVLNKNEAYAFASCQHCSAEAVSFQIVLIVGSANVVVPQNISAAVNYNCVSCLTQALAVQLVLTLPSAPTPQEIRDINALWAQIQAFGRHLQGLPFNVIRAVLAGFERQIIAVIQRDSGGVAPKVVSPTTSAPGSSPASDTAGAPGGAAPGTDAGNGTPATDSATTPAASTPASTPTAPPSTP
jgi:putative peptide zinc metalloprotease protein